MSGGVSLTSVSGLIDPVYVVGAADGSAGGRRLSAQIAEQVGGTLALMIVLAAAVWTLIWAVERWREAQMRRKFSTTRR